MKTTDMTGFMRSFFAPSPEEPEYSLLLKVFSAVGDHIWAYTSLTDILNVSVSSRLCASLPISSDVVQTHVDRSRMSHIGNFRLTFSSAVSLGILRRMLHRVNIGNTAVISIDENSGRIIVDIGSAFKDRDAFLASNVTLLPAISSADSYGTAIDNADQVILKHLEVSSYDEYDDFNPRHPLPKDKTHRRGGSYFNSDIELYATEAVADEFNDLQNIAFQALNLEGIDEESILNTISSQFGRGR